MTITRESLKAVSYLNVEQLGEGRTITLMPFWDGADWRVWMPSPEGLKEKCWM
jgi:hypothetical protein